MNQSASDTDCASHRQIRPPPDEQHLPLSFGFPEGSLIGIAKEKLPVTVSFTGSRPTSFTANVVFLDEEGKRFSLPITGTTDASLLTVKPFMDVSSCHLVHYHLHCHGSLFIKGSADVMPCVQPLLTVVHGCDFPTTCQSAVAIHCQHRMLLEVKACQCAAHSAGNFTHQRLGRKGNNLQTAYMQTCACAADADSC